MNSKTQHVVRTPQGKGYVPSVRIAGEYLKGLNFNVKDEVTIFTGSDVIIITKQDVLQRMENKNPTLSKLIQTLSLTLD